MANDIITTAFTQHTVYLQRVGASLGLDVIPYLEEIERQVQVIFARYEGRGITVKNRLAIQQQINEVSREQLQLYVRELKKDIREIGVNEADFAATILNDVVENDDFEADTPSAAQINIVAISTPVKIGDKAFISYNSLIANYWQKWTAEIDGIVMAGFTDGQTINEVAENVYSQLRLTTSDTSKNTLTRAKRSARQLAITGTNHYANQARVAFVDYNDDILKGYRFLAVLDSRTSQQCRALDQTFIPKDSPKLSSLTPPLHPNCRSALTYEVDERYSLDDKDTQRASAFEVDGKRDPKPVSSDGIYYEKLKQLSARDQDAVLGSTLGKAFRKMDNPEDFAKATIDRLGNPLTITQMKQRDNQLGRLLRSQSN